MKKILLLTLCVVLVSCGKVKIKTTEVISVVLMDKEFLPWQDKMLNTFMPLTPAVCTLIWNEAKDHQMNPSFLMAWIEIESGFDSMAVSSKGAVGLLQVKPSTGQIYVGYHLKKKDLYVSDTNVKIALKHFMYLKNKYANDALALQAYNMGEYRLDALMNEGKDIGFKYYSKIKNKFLQLERS